MGGCRRGNMRPAATGAQVPYASTETSTSWTGTS